MQSEKLTEKSLSYSVNIAGGKVESLRVTEDLKTVARVYDGGFIGIAGAIGESDEEELFNKARENLSSKIPYPCALSESVTRQADVRGDNVSAADFLKSVKAMVGRLNLENPDFIFSNKINRTEVEKTYSNCAGTDLSYCGSAYDIALLIKDRSSANIFDLCYGGTKRRFDADGIVADIEKLLTAYRVKAELPGEELPVIIAEDCAYNMLSEMTAESYINGASLFNSKFNRKIFDDKVNIVLDRSPQCERQNAFFDDEGVINDDDKFYFVRQGVFCGLATYKRTAQSSNLPLSGGANAEFDAVPTVGFNGTTFIPSHASVKDIVAKRAIYVAYTSGGDMTPDGNLGIPVQLAYLVEDGKLIARLPEFSLSGNVYEVFGDKFYGAADNDIFDYVRDRVIVSGFTINR